MTTTESPELADTTSDNTNPGKVGQIKIWLSEELECRPRPMTERFPSGKDMIEYSRSGAWTLDPEGTHRRKFHGIYTRAVAIPLIAVCSFIVYLAARPERFGAALLVTTLTALGIFLWIVL